jgi:putative nucleotidyltransferase with HDIG domain
VNDLYGHLEGDAVLRGVARLLEQNSRRSDVVARYGGDEFVILMPETTVEQAQQLANKWRAYIASDLPLRAKSITASFGIASYPLHGATPQELIQVADSAMYLAKHQGGNHVSTADQFDPQNAPRWKRDVLEAYLGISPRRPFVAGPETFGEISRRVKQFVRAFREPGIAGAEQLPLGFVQTLVSLADAIEAHDHCTQGHSRKVSAYAVMAAQRLGLTLREVEEIRMAALLHDVGKIGIPDAILNKAGPLEAPEWVTMQTHAALGADLLQSIGALGGVPEIVRHHHESYDGSGYPGALCGPQIPLGSRLIAIADAYDALTSERAFHKLRNADEAFAELQRCASLQFDHELVRVFVETVGELPSPIIDSSFAAPGFCAPAELEHRP